MLALSGNISIFLYDCPMDLRKSFEGLSAAVEKTFPGKLRSGSYFAFLNRRRDRMKILSWDGDGLAIWYKRLEMGSYSYRHQGKTSMTRREFFLLLEGVVPKRLQLRYNTS